MMISTKKLYPWWNGFTPFLKKKGVFYILRHKLWLINYIKLCWIVLLVLTNENNLLTFQINHGVWIPIYDDLKMKRPQKEMATKRNYKRLYIDFTQGYIGKMYWLTLDNLIIWKRILTMSLYDLGRTNQKKTIVKLSSC